MFLFLIHIKHRSDKGVQNVPNISIRFLEPNEDHSELWMNFLLDGDRYILRDVIPHHGSIRYENGAVFIYEDDCFAGQIWHGFVQSLYEFLRLTVMRFCRLRIHRTPTFDKEPKK